MYACNETKATREIGNKTKHQPYRIKYIFAFIPKLNISANKVQGVHPNATRANATNKTTKRQPYRPAIAELLYPECSPVRRSGVRTLRATPAAYCVCVCVYMFWYAGDFGVGAVAADAAAVQFRATRRVYLGVREVVHL